MRPVARCRIVLYMSRHPVIVTPIARHFCRQCSTVTRAISVRHGANVAIHVEEMYADGRKVRALSNTTERTARALVQSAAAYCVECHA